MDDLHLIQLNIKLFNAKAIDIESQENGGIPGEVERMRKKPIRDVLFGKERGRTHDVTVHNSQHNIAHHTLCNFASASHLKDATGFCFVVHHST